MTDSIRVANWRKAKRKQGLKAVTIWLTTDQELRLKDLALQCHCSPSVLVQQALAQFSPHTVPSISTATDISQIRELIRAEFLAMQAEKTIATDTVAEVVTDTLARDLPALVRQLVEGLALEALGLPVTATPSDVTDTEEPGEMPDAEGPAEDLEESSSEQTPAYDTSKHYLGELCPRSHDWHGTGHSLRHTRNRVCLECDREKTAERRAAQRQAKA